MAPDKFKGSLTAVAAANAIARGVLDRHPHTGLRCVPVADGGEGTVEAVVGAGFDRRRALVRGPTGNQVDAAFAMRAQTAVIEMAEASGLGLLDGAAPAPLTATTYGTGQLIRAALDAGAREVVLGIGGSAATDGGAGMAQALGARLLDRDGAQLEAGGAALSGLARIDISGLDPRVTGTRFTVACDVGNPLIGPQGAAAVYGPQKGASDHDVGVLDAALTGYAQILRRDLGADVAQTPGAGAAGGLGAGAIAFLHAHLASGVDLLLETVGFAEALAGADLVLTGEGSLDEQSLSGKAPVGVARAAAAAGVAAIALCGRVLLTPAQLREGGFVRAWSLLDLEPDQDQAHAQAGPLLTRLASQAVSTHWESGMAGRPRPHRTQPTGTTDPHIREDGSTQMTTSTTSVDGVEIAGDPRPDVLTAPALEWLAELERTFGSTRRSLLATRAERQAERRAGASLDFLTETKDVRDDDWAVAPPPPALRNRRVEITGPTDAKMLINALNSGSTGFMADFEDSNTPTWFNVIQGQANIREAIAGTLRHTSADGREYALNDEVAVLLVRPRGWHLDERHLLVDGRAMTGALVDFGLHVFHNATTLAERGLGPYFYVPKMESHLEARLWNKVFTFAEERFELAPGTMKATVLIETLPAAFEMDEMLYELREHSAGLNAGRWDYLFSAIKTFPDRPEFILPDRNGVTMAAPFMRSYAELLVKTCHRRGAHAMGGMAAFIPSRRDAELNEKALAKVHEDKRREATAGFDGTWVAHPDLVPVAMEEFDAVLGERDNQLDRQRDDVEVTAADLLDVASAEGQITEEGLHNDVNVTIQYLSSWLRGNGAAAIYNLMEDVATAEIARSQIWQWIHHGVSLTDGRHVTRDLVRDVASDELAKIRDQVGEEFFATSRADDAMEVFEEVCLSDELVDFLTIPAYERLG